MKEVKRSSGIKRGQMGQIMHLKLAWKKMRGQKVKWGQYDRVSNYTNRKLFPMASCMHLRGQGSKLHTPIMIIMKIWAGITLHTTGSWFLWLPYAFERSGVKTEHSKIVESTQANSIHFTHLYSWCPHWMPFLGQPTCFSQCCHST
jgi:hypothetical protein